MSNDLSAGACVADITPTDLRNVFLAGFGPGRKADHVIDPLHARALYLNDGANEFALVTFDLIGLMAPDAARLREAAGEIDPSRVWIACTHNHHGPDTMGLWGPSPGAGIPVASGVDRRYMDFLFAETGRILRRAKRLARRARVHFGCDRSDKSDMTWNIRDRAILDHELSCMVLRRADDGRVIATVTNFGSHPETLWDKNTGVSADYLAHFHPAVENELGGVSLFLNGALGGMVTPGIPMDASYADRLVFYKRYGEHLAEIAVAAARGAEYQSACEIILREYPVTIPICNPMLKFANALGVLARPADWRGTESSAGLLDIGPARFIAAPGEVLPAFGLELKSLVGGSPRFLISLCNDELGYLLPPTYFKDENYRYEISVSPGRRTADILKDAYRRSVSHS